VCADKDSERVEEIEDQVRRVCGEDAQVTVLSRGRIKGVNTAGDCTLCLLQGLSTFTGISDCALHACLQYRRTFPDTHVFNDKGQPLWDRDGMRVPAMRDYYALRSLDEIYQAVWRTRREINQSMSDDDKDKWMDKKSAGRNECNAEYYGVNRKLVNKKLKKGEDAAGKHAPSLVDKTCFYAVNTVSTGIGEGGKTGLLQALGLVFCEFFHAVFDEIKDIYNNGFSKGFNDPRFLKVLKKRLLRISKRVAARWVDACTAFRDGFISGFLSNMVTVIINMFITTYKRTVRIIREGFYSLVKAIKMLCCPPEGMTFAEAAHESTKLIAAGLAVIGGVTLEGCCDGMLKGTPFAPFSDIISSVLVGGLTGLATTFIVYVIDKIDLFKVNEKKKHEYVMQKLEADFDLMFSDGIALIEEITPCYP